MNEVDLPVCAEYDGSLGVSQLKQSVPQVSSGNWIQSTGWLIEKNESR